MTSSADNIGWNFDNTYRRLPGNLFSLCRPESVRLPRLAVFNEPLAHALGLSAAVLQKEEGVAVLAGNRVPAGAEPLAQAYAGHQFGYFTMLGDGRALLLGEQIAPSGERFDVQLKGSGRTPYSRGGDGKAALGPMLREYLISEAMNALGIPTTRSLAVVTTGEMVRRETDLPGAVLTRVAASHIRVGTFQFVAKWGSREELKTLADYTLRRHFPSIAEVDEKNPTLALLKQVIARQAKLIAAWQLVGFVHGVMNTDNVALSGETIDYGPCAFLDVYDPATAFSSIDVQGRYAFGNQPAIAAWNLSRFAETLIPIIDDQPLKAVQIAQDALAGFFPLFRGHWLDGMRDKLGLFGEKDGDEALIDDLLAAMRQHRADYTNTFRALTLQQTVHTPLFDSPEFARWMARWKERLDAQRESKQAAQKLMRQSNPAVIPRNHRVEEALGAATERGDYSVTERLLSVLSRPFAYAQEQQEYAELPEQTDCPYRTFCGT